MMSTETIYLGEFEELVLLAVAGLGENAYGMKIRQAIEEIGGRFTSIGAVYATLDRLEGKGYVSSEYGEATAERGGRAKRYFRIEERGSKALDNAEGTRARIRRELSVELKPA
jgi:DNA-binding PadR family transcriptional regulator